MAGGLLRLSASRAAGSDALDPAVRRGRHLGRGCGALDEAPEVGSREAAQDSSLAAGEDRRVIARFDAGGFVADSVDAPVDDQKRPLLNPSPDLFLRDPRSQELPPSDQAVLFPGNPRKDFFDCPVPVFHTNT